MCKRLLPAMPPGFIRELTDICFHLLVSSIQTRDYAEAEALLLPPNNADITNAAATQPLPVPGGAAGYRLLGLICQRTGRPEAAANYYRTCLTLDSSNWSAYAALCDLADASTGSELLKVDKEDPGVWTRLGMNAPLVGKKTSVLSVEGTCIVSRVASQPFNFEQQYFEVPSASNFGSLLPPANLGHKRAAPIQYERGDENDPTLPQNLGSAGSTEPLSPLKQATNALRPKTAMATNTHSKVQPLSNRPMARGGVSQQAPQGAQTTVDRTGTPKARGHTRSHSALVTSSGAPAPATGLPPARPLRGARQASSSSSLASGTVADPVGVLCFESEAGDLATHEEAAQLAQSSIAPASATRRLRPNTRSSASNKPAGAVVATPSASTANTMAGTRRHVRSSSSALMTGSRLGSTATVTSTRVHTRLGDIGEQEGSFMSTVPSQHEQIDESEERLGAHQGGTAVGREDNNDQSEDERSRDGQHEGEESSQNLDTAHMPLPPLSTVRPPVRTRAARHPPSAVHASNTSKAKPEEDEVGDMESEYEALEMITENATSAHAQEQEGQSALEAHQVTLRRLQEEEHAAKQEIQESLMVLKTIATAYALARRYKCIEALQVLRKALPLANLNTAFCRGLEGLCLFEMSNHVDACASFAKMRALDPGFTQFLDIYSTSLWHLRQEVELTVLAQQVSERLRGIAQTWVVVGNCFSLQRDSEQALKFFKRAVAVDPNYAYAHTLCGHEYMAADDMEHAVACYRKGVAADSRCYRAWYGLASVLQREERFDVAIQHYKRAIMINPRSSVLFCLLGVVLHAHHQSQEALRAFAKASELDPKNPLVRLQRANVLASLHRYNEALEELEECISMAPGEANAHFLMGKVLRALGRPEKALAAYNAAMDLDPRSKRLIQVAIEKLNLGQPTSTGKSAVQDVDDDDSFQWLQ